MLSVYKIVHSLLWSHPAHLFPLFPNSWMRMFPWSPLKRQLTILPLSTHPTCCLRRWTRPHTSVIQPVSSLLVLMPPLPVLLLFLPSYMWVFMVDFFYSFFFSILPHHAPSHSSLAIMFQGFSFPADRIGEKAWKKCQENKKNIHIGWKLAFLTTLTLQLTHKWKQKFFMPLYHTTLLYLLPLRISFCCANSPIFSYCNIFLYLSPLIFHLSPLLHLSLPSLHFSSHS